MINFTLNLAVVVGVDVFAVDSMFISISACLLFILTLKPSN